MSRSILQQLFVMVLLMALLAAGLSGHSAAKTGPGDPETAGSGVSQTAHAAPPAPAEATYPVLFRESGLPSGAAWEVGVSSDGSTYWEYANSTAPTATESLSNGSYRFNASSPVAGYSAGWTNAAFDVSGSATSVNVTFVPAAPLTFSETGLPSEHGWTVSVESGEHWENATILQTSVVVDVPLGPYAYSVTATGFNASPSTGNGTLTAAVGVPIGFSPALQPPGFITGVITVGNAHLYINGLAYLVQLGGGFLVPVQPGVYSIIVDAAGYIPYYNTTFVASNETLILSITLHTVATAPGPVCAPGPSIGTEAWAAIGALAAVSVVLGTAMIYYRRKSR